MFLGIYLHRIKLKIGYIFITRMLRAMLISQTLVNYVCLYTHFRQNWFRMKNDIDKTQLTMSRQSTLCLVCTRQIWFRMKNDIDTLSWLGLDKVRSAWFARGKVDFEIFWNPSYNITCSLIVYFYSTLTRQRAQLTNIVQNDFSRYTLNC